MGASARYASNGTRKWYQWLGFQVFSSCAVADDLRSDATGQTIGAKVYVGCDSYSVTCLKAVNGTVLSSYTTQGQVSSSPAIWDGKLYVGSVDGKVYCFDDAPRVSTGIYAASNKGEQMWSNETITISGKVHAIENYTNAYDVTKQYYPGLPNATVILSINKPDLSAVNVTTTTDNMGDFTASYSPTEVGDWGWVAYYKGQQLPYVTYNAAYTEWNSFKVTAPPIPETPTPTPTPPPSGIPVEYIYVAVAVIAIVLIAIGAYAYTKRSKK
jgi:outer membrane protein assembly factor BamB